MRLDRYLANSGVGTRREVKEYIKKRLIKVNDAIVIDTSKNIDENNDLIKYNDKIINYRPYVYIMLNKPKGVISATEDKEHKTVIDLLENNYRTYSLFPMGRLDIDTEGLLILTNDGQLSHELLSPIKHVSKKYYVEVRDPLSDDVIKIVEDGVEIEKGIVTKKAKIELIENSDVPIDKNNGNRNYSKLNLTITEGKYHQIKRMFKAVGNKVVYLKRIEMGKLKLDKNLKLGEYRELTETEINVLRSGKI